MQNNKIKFVYKAGISIFIAFLFKILFFKTDEFFDFDLIYITGIVFILWEGNLLINKWLNNRYKWLENPKKRLIIQAISSTIFTTIILFDLMFIIHQIKFSDGEIINRKMQETFIPAVFFTYILLTITVGSQFFKAWKQSLVDVEKHKTESANAQLQNLKNQLNPHFLFNNLSVLTSLVHKNQDKAVDFINELSKVYRYVLDNKSYELVSLQVELNFLDHYIYLLKIRFDSGISFIFNIDDKLKSANLLPMCLQMLVENTIQHNEISQENPLQVSIYTYNNTLVIENPVHPRSGNIEGTNTGLKNIQSRYSYFTDEKVEIFNDGKIFKVVLPLISKG